MILGNGLNSPSFLKKTKIHIKMKQETTQSKEVLNITPGEWEIFENPYPQVGTTYIVADCFNSYFTEDRMRANAKAICTAVNETYKKGYNPAAIDELYKALDDLTDRFDLYKKSELFDNNDKQALDNAKAVLTNSKL